MTSEQFRKYWWATPFKAFAMHLADGRWLPILHPENVAISTSGRMVSVIDPKVDAFETVDLLLVTSLRPLNGNEHRRKNAR
jgi:hypothetical protein